MINKRYLLIGAAVPFVLLNGCSIGQNNQDKSIPIEKVDMSRYEQKTMDGEFQGLLNKKFIDIKVNDQLQTFYVKEGVTTNQIDTLKKGDKLQFVYALSEKTGQKELQAITHLNGVVVETQEAPKPVKDQLQKNEVKKVEMEVDYPTSTKIVKAVESEFIEGGGHFKAIDYYDWDGERLTNDDKETEIRFADVPDTIVDDIQKERWRASSILKEEGELVEDNEKNRGELDILSLIHI